jgi:uncharacterized protein (TIGR04222 family)
MAKSSAPHQSTWTAEEIGFLAGGPGRAVEAALARLMDGGHVRMSREGLVTAVHQNGYGATTALEAFILAGLHGAGRPFGHVVGPASHSQEMNALRRTLVDRALVRRQWGRSRNRGFRTLLFVLAIVSAVAAGIFDRNLFALSAVLLFFVFLMRNKKMLTPLGKGVLGHARRNPRGPVDTVALNGLPNAIRRPVPVRHGRTRATSNCGSSSCGGSYDHHSCGSSCSSNSCNSSSSCSSSSCSSSSSSSCSSSSSSCSSSSS